MKHIKFLSETFKILVVKFSIYLNRRNFVMVRHFLFALPLGISKLYSVIAHFQDIFFITKTCLFKYTENFTP